MVVRTPQYDQSESRPPDTPANGGRSPLEVRRRGDLPGDERPEGYDWAGVGRAGGYPGDWRLNIKINVVNNLVQESGRAGVRYY